jgi:UDP-N-acetyl-D-galactosamine dehydrogenase
MGINTNDVLEAAGTKWNFIPFKPGFCGGHCISVDPYYLSHKAEELGYLPQMILSGRRLNDSMAPYVAGQVLKLMVSKCIDIKHSKVLVLGITFKENCPDIRNSKVADVIRELKDFGCNVDVYDPHAGYSEVKKEFGINLKVYETELEKYDAIVVAVAHDEFLDINLEKYKKNPCIVYDVKRIIKESDGGL